MIPIGLDLSLTSTGWAVWGGACGRIRPKGISGIERRTWIAGQVGGVVEKAGWDWGKLAVIEAVPTARAFAAVPLGMLHGVVLKELDDIDVGAIAYVTTGVLKKHLAGTGTAKKEQMVAAAQALGYQGKSNDEADAYGLALIGHHLLGGTTHLTPQRAALLASVAWEIPMAETAG